jgi:hypothetical protein
MKKICMVITAVLAVMLYAGDAVCQMPQMPANPLTPSIQPLPSAPQAWAKLRMINNSPFEVDLYVNDNYECTAKPHSTCTTKIAARTDHYLSAKSGGNIVKTRQSPVNFEENEEREWTVSYKE